MKKAVLIFFLGFAQLASAQSDSTYIRDSLTRIPDIRFIRLDQPTIQTLPKVNFHSPALFCRMEASLRRKTGIDWNIGMDVK